MALYFDDTVVVTDTGVNGRRFRGAQVTSIAGNTLALTLYHEANILGAAVVPRSLAPHVVLGDPQCAELAPEGYGVVALHDTRFACIGETNDSVQRGVFAPGAVPRELHGQPRRLHWASGHLNERSGYWGG